MNPIEERTGTFAGAVIMPLAELDLPAGIDTERVRHV